MQRTIVQTSRNLTNTHDTALRISIVLAGDLGVASEIEEIPGGHQVVADDGKVLVLLGKEE